MNWNVEHQTNMPERGHPKVECKTKRISVDLERYNGGYFGIPGTDL